MIVLLAALASAGVFPAPADAQAPPATPAAVEVTRADGTLTASWDAIAGATRYHVTYSSDGGGSWHGPVDDNQNVATNTLTFSVDNAATYIVGVRAGNDHGWSGWKNSPPAGPFTPPTPTPAPTPSPTPPPPPGPVAGVSVARADGTLTAAWEAVAEATKYHVTYSSDGGGSWSLGALDHPDASLVISGVDNAATYLVGVRAGNEAGWSGWTNSPPAGPFTPPEPPAAPGGLTATAGDGSVTLAWADPSDASLSGYEYRVNHNATDTGNFSGWGEWQGIEGSGATTTAHALADLTNGREYRYQLRAVNADGAGPPAPDAEPWFVSATPHEPAPEPPAAPTGLTAAAGDGSVTLSWADPSDASITGYEYSVRYAGAAWSAWTAIPASGAATASHVFTGLENGVEYRYKVRAVNADGAGPPAPDADPWYVSATPQAVPPTLTVDNVTSTGATITLSNHSGAWHYRAEPQPDDDAGANAAAGGACVGPIQGASAEVGGLTPGTNYTITAYGDPCGGAFAASQSFATTTPVLNVPQPPATSGVISIGNWSHDWWLEETSDNTIACKRISAGGVENVTFPAGSGYVYRQYLAYGKAGCKDEDGARDLIASGYYKRLPPIYLTKSNVSLTYAELRIHGFTGNWSLGTTNPDGSHWCKVGYSSRYPAKLRDLQPGTEYSYTAYRYFSCHGSAAIAGITFNTLGPGDRNPALDFDTLIAAGNNAPLGLWSDGVTLWVGDSVDAKLYAYKRSDKIRDSSKDIDLHSDTGSPRGLWSDGVTLWVLDTAKKIYAYKRSDKTRDSSKDIDLHSENGFPMGLWSDGVTMWVADWNDTKLYAYKLSDRTRDASKDFNTLSAAGNNLPHGLWSDGVTLWVADWIDDKVYAYKLSDKSRDPARDFDTLNTAGNNTPFSLWSDGVTLWVVDHGDAKLYAYYAFPKLTGSADTPTSATLTLSNGNYGSWWFKRTAPSAGTCTASESDLSHALSGLTESTTYTYKAYKAAGCASADEIGSVTFSTPAPGDRKAAQDFDTLDTGNDFPHGLWSDGVTMWVADLDLHYDKLYAYKLSDKSRDSSKDFDALDRGNGYPRDLWSDGVTMWVVGDRVDRLYAYKLSDQSRDAAKDIDLHADNDLPTGLWSDGVTMWVADDDARLYAYKLSDQSRDAAKDIDLHADNAYPFGLWSDGVTLWVADDDDNKIYAYKLSDGSRDAARDFDTLSAAGNNYFGGLWSDGVTMWVADPQDDKIYAYHAFPPLVATDVAPTSATLSLGRHTGSWWLKQTAPSAGTCTAGESDYSHALTGLTKSTTYSYTAYSKSGCNSADAIDSATFGTLPAPGDRNAALDFDTLSAAGNGYPYGLWSDGVTMWVADPEDDKIYAYKRSDKSRDAAKDFDTLNAAGNHDPWGLWSDGVTMWVADYGDDKVYAYKLSDKTRDSSKDFDTLSAAGNDYPHGLWSDGTTMWVSDYADAKLYAYKRSDQSRDAAKDIDLHADNAHPRGLWSDGVTLWVADYSDDKLYAYKLSDKSRDATRDIDTLNAAGNTWPNGVWSDGVTLWVADSGADKLYAYYAFPKLTASAVAPTSATLTLSNKNYGASWWIKRTAPSAGTCTAGESDFSHALSGLMASTTYTYKAYSDSGCTSANEIAEVTFSTPGPGDQADRDFDRLSAAGNTTPHGIWSDGSRMWVADRNDTKLYAYSRLGNRRGLYDFDLDSDNAIPTGLWSDGVTMWVADWYDAKLYAYKRSDKSRDAAKDFDLHTNNAHPFGVWSDGVTLWVADDGDDKIYAYKLSDETRDSAKDIDLHADNDRPHDVWSDGVTMWVADLADGKVYAYKLSDATRDATKDIDLHADNDSPRGLWSDGTTLWVSDYADGKLYAYYAFPKLTASADTLTSATLTLSNSNYGSNWWLKRTGPTAGTCTAGEVDSSRWDFSHAVSGLTNSTTYTYKAYKSAGCASADEVGSVTFSTPAPGDRKAGQDFDTLSAAGNGFPLGLWSDGVTLWVADDDDDKIYAYKLSDKTRDAAKDFDTLSAAGNNHPLGLWSDGTTMWVADHADDKIYAYKLSDKSRDSSKDFDTLSAAGNDSPLGLWSDGVTLWVADDADDKIYAYKLSDKTRDAAKDFDTLSAAGNDSPLGLWSDGVTLWVADDADDKIYAYKLSDKTRDAAKDFDTLSAAGNNHPYGLWSDGTTMWVADYADAKLYAYHAFQAELLASAVTPTSATLTLSNYGASWWLKRISPSAGTCTAGEADFSHAVSDLMGNTTYTYTAYSKSGCASADEIDSVTFRTPGPGDPNAAQDFDTLAALTNDPRPWGLWSDGVTMWVAERKDDKIYAYKRSDKSRDSSKDIDLHSDNTAPYGIWSDGTTMWVEDSGDDKLYAYKLSDQSRDSAKDFDLHADNADPFGLWSDGVTLWVADSGDAKIYAYKLSDETRDSAKDIDLHSDNDRHRGIWSDGVTMWVADWSDDNRIYAYKLSDGSRDAARDFDTLSAANTHPRGIWSDGTTLWVVQDHDNKLYAYYAFPTLTASAVAATSATLTLSNSNYGSNWWLKQTSPTPAGTCTAGESDFSHALGSLTASTTYTYKAYSDSGCTSANEIAEVTFTTPSS